ncbi:MAG: YicC family protein [Candidatus Omnitrophica bacterium]|nr:YicC family protein [Candidatus Omnitrophota bacterium]
MIRGMTGFGQAAGEASGGRFVLEIKSLNHKFLDVVLHLPPGFNIFESRITKLVQKKVRRGRITVALNFSSPPKQSIVLNKSLAQDYYKNLKVLSRQLGLSDSIKLSDIVSLSGVIEIQSAKISADMWPKVNAAFDAAFHALIKMREQEGLSIYQDVNSKLQLLQGFLSQIPSRAKFIATQKGKSLSQDDLPLFLRNSDINEEVSRLKYHINNFQKKLKMPVVSGKELDFISQELQREINTVGAKLPDTQITSYVIKIKDLIEKIREQLQNVE